MPYYIQSDALLTVFPEQCAYCRNGAATSTSRQPFSTLKLSAAFGARSEARAIDLPACPGCSRWFRYTEWLLWVAGIVVLSGLLWVVLASAWLDSDLPIYLWVGAMAAWVGLRLWRSLRRKALQLSFSSAKHTVYEARDEGYARQLAELNGLVVRDRPVVLELS